MSNRIFAVIVGVAVFLVVGWYLSVSSEQADIKSERRDLFADLLSENITKIDITKGQESVGLALDGTRWTLRSRAGYSADPSRVNSLLLKVVGLTTSQRVGELDSESDTFGLTDRAVAEAGQSKVVFSGSRGELGTLYLGITRESAVPGVLGSPGTGGQYVRRAGESGIYLIKEPIAVSADVTAWLNTNLVNVLPSRIKSIEHLKLSEEDTVRSFYLEQVQSEDATGVVPEFKIVEPKLTPETVNPEVIALLRSGLDNLRMHDVLPESEFGSLFTNRTVYTLDNGLVYVIDAVKVDAEYFSRISVSLAVASDQKAEGENGEQDAQSPVRVTQATQSEVESLNSRFQGWVYKLPDYIGRKFIQSTDKLVLNPSVGTM